MKYPNFMKTLNSILSYIMISKIALDQYCDSINLIKLIDSSIDMSVDQKLSTLIDIQISNQHGEQEHI